MTLKILVVDDEPDVLTTIKALAEPYGTEVLTTADSREAAQRVNCEKFDGVFVDALMPHLDGFGLTKLIRASSSNSNVPIVMLTGSDDLQTIRRAFRAGVTFFLGKPVSLRRVSSILNAMRGPMLAEKRRYARLPFRTTVRCRFGSRQVTVETLNISEGGMLLERSGGATMGEEVDLEFELPKTLHALRPRGKVVRKDSADRMAIQFIRLEARDREAVQRFVMGWITQQTKHGSNGRGQS